MRMRAAYFLRQEYDNAIRNGASTSYSIVFGENNDGAASSNKDTAGATEEDTIASKVIHLLGVGLCDPRHGSLLRHEFAYVMGQLRDERCCPALERTLLDETDCVMVRHECGEALGAIAAQRSVSVLKAAIGANPNSPEIGETCQLALDHMQWKSNGGDASGIEEPMACACMLSPYSSVDPAPPHPQHAAMSALEIGTILRDETLPLFERYRAMFSLRNKGGEDCVLQLGRTLVEDESSALLRHEVAYVLGQMQHSASVECLAESLRRTGEHAMVRHESAEALGAIEGRWEDCEVILNEFLSDHDVVVRESCMVALDAADYWGHGGDDTSSTDIAEEKDGEEEEKEQPKTFVLQKAVTNGRVENDDLVFGATATGNKGASKKNGDPAAVADAVRLNHFNVVS
jgi:deoxyhypusine monooxygenase